MVLIFVHSLWRLEACDWHNSDSFEQRDAATAPTVGDRVPYVIIKAAKGAKVTDMYLLL